MRLGLRSLVVETQALFPLLFILAIKQIIFTGYSLLTAVCLKWVKRCLQFIAAVFYLAVSVANRRLLTRRLQTDDGPLFCFGDARICCLRY